MTERRPRAALLSLVAGLTLAGASAAGPVGPGRAGADGGPAEPGRADAGRPSPNASRDGGQALLLDAQDQAVVRDLEGLEHLGEAELLELLLPVRDQ